MSNNRFIPNDNEVFYFICLDGGIMHRNFDGKDEMHVGMLHMGNCFPTEEAAKLGRQAMRLVLEELAVNQYPENGKKITIRLVKE